MPLAGLKKNRPAMASKISSENLLREKLSLKIHWAKFCIVSAACRASFPEGGELSIPSTFAETGRKDFAALRPCGLASGASSRPRQLATRLPLSSSRRPTDPLALRESITRRIPSSISSKASSRLGHLATGSPSLGNACKSLNSLWSQPQGLRIIGITLAAPS